MGGKPRFRLASRPFTNETFGFLIELSMNNHRDWFEQNRDFFDRAIKTPLESFIEDFAPRLREISPHFLANKRSMFRIHRDVRFSKDKSPYKTHAAAHFRHEAAADVHAPGFYLHIHPGEIFVGAGVWRPDTQALLRIRKHIAEHPKAWRAVIQCLEPHKARLAGESLARPPRGFAPDHPLIEDIKRKSYIAIVDLADEDLLAKDVATRYAQACKHLSPLVALLCDALGVPF